MLAVPPCCSAFWLLLLLLLLVTPPHLVCVRSLGDGSGAIDMAAAEAAAAGAAGLRPVAVFELVQADRDVAFPEVIALLRKCLLVSRVGGWGFG